MDVPAVNLRPSLKATEADWRAHLDRLFEKSHFVLGEQVECFEREFAEELGARFAVGVGTGTAAIELCLREAGLANTGRHVLTSALTAPFTAVAIQAAGCVPCFADIDPETLLLDAEDAGKRVTKKTAAVAPVHLYGQPCDLERFSALCRDRKVVLLQDACQAHGARYKGRPLTDYSPYVAYSFYPTKNLGCLGDGGAVLTNRVSVNRRLRMLRDGGRRGGQVSFLVGINSRLDEMQACYLRAFLPRLEEWNLDRARTAAIYDEELAGCEGVRPVRRSESSVNHLYVVRARRRDALRAYLAKQGIGSGIHYPVPLHLHPAFRDGRLQRGGLPNAEKACREIVSLPIWPYMPAASARRVADLIRSFYR